MRVMILGAGGMLGRDLALAPPSGISPVTFRRADLDITNTDRLARTVSKLHPSVVINAAAYTAVDRAEAESHVAFAVNATAVGALGQISAEQGARVLHLSTDYVSTERRTNRYGEEHATNPVNVYGASKLAGEIALSQSGAEYLIIRTQWLFGIHGTSFLRRCGSGLEPEL